MSNPSRPPVWQLAILLILSVAGSVALLAATPKGLGVSSDSVAYLGAARNQAGGLGLARLTGDGGADPMTHFPPLYPLLLAGLELLGLPALPAARLIAAIVFAGSALLTGILVWRCSGSILASVIGVSLFVVSPHMLETHSWAMTEGLFIFLGLAALVALAEYGAARRRGILVLAASAVAAAYLTRYIGIALLISAALYLSLLPGSIRRRSTDLAILLAIGVVPMIAWMIRNLLRTGSATNRTLQFHLPPAESLQDGLRVIWQWLVPYAYPAWGAASLLLLTACVMVLILWIERPIRQVPRRLAGFLSQGAGRPVVLYFLSYLTVLVASLLLLDASTPIDQRLASPLLSLSIVLLASALPWLWRAPVGKGLLRLALVLGVTLFLVSSLSRRQWLVRSMRYEARGLASPLWADSGVGEILDTLPENSLLFADNPEILYFISGRGAFGLPTRFDNVTMRERTDYSASLSDLRRRLDARGGAVVVFSDPQTALEASSIEDVTRDLILVYASGEARVYLTPELAR
jgi:uncharacterized membrane protein